jgi:hypothetical protein
MTMYLPITELNETGAEVDEFLDVSISDQPPRPGPSEHGGERALDGIRDPGSSSRGPSLSTTAGKVDSNGWTSPESP